mmetsp:Transcript_9510/g.39106  ORF Transcript_9510/g.39106 Transcript_9510/m.39106 type:complete len:337 (-) Transcript_9510:331-1341(-)
MAWIEGVVRGALGSLQPAAWQRSADGGACERDGGGDAARDGVVAHPVEERARHQRCEHPCRAPRGEDAAVHVAEALWEEARGHRREACHRGAIAAPHHGQRDAREPPGAGRQSGARQRRHRAGPHEHSLGAARRGVGGGARADPAEEVGQRSARHHARGGTGRTARGLPDARGVRDGHQPRGGACGARELKAEHGAAGGGRGLGVPARGLCRFLGHRQLQTRRGVERPRGDGERHQDDPQLQKGGVGTEFGDARLEQLREKHGCGDVAAHREARGDALGQPLESAALDAHHVGGGEGRAVSDAVGGAEAQPEADEERREGLRQPARESEAHAAKRE